MDEQSLIQKVQEGNLKAFGSLMDIHVRRLRAVIALNAPVPHLIDEIAHETYVFAFNHINDFQRGTSFFAWLKSIAWNLLRAEIQRFSREQANQLKYAEKRVFDVAPGKPLEHSAKELDGLREVPRARPPEAQAAQPDALPPLVLHGGDRGARRPERRGGAGRLLPPAPAAQGLRAGQDGDGEGMTDKELIDAFVSGELDEAGMAQLEAELRANPDLIRELADQQQIEQMT